MRRFLTALVVTAFVLMGVFPPWVYTWTKITTAETPAGYWLIFNPPSPKPGKGTEGVQLDLRRLLVQWATVAAALFVLRRGTA